MDPSLSSALGGLVDARKEVSMNPDDEWKKARDWVKDLPSPEHRRHIRLFQGLADLTDEQDVALRGYVVWKRLNHALTVAAALAVKQRTKRRSK
jgi:hypothetical protein